MRDHEAVTDVAAPNESADITISYGIFCSTMIPTQAQKAMVKSEVKRFLGIKGIFLYIISNLNAALSDSHPQILRKSRVSIVWHPNVPDRFCRLFIMQPQAELITNKCLKIGV